VNGDDIERVVAVAGPFDHLLEHRPLVVGPGRGLDKFRDRLMALGFAPGQNLRPLVRNRKVMLPLSIR
jgi:Fe2+ transport system protein FeoA